MQDYNSQIFTHVGETNYEADTLVDCSPVQREEASPLGMTDEQLAIFHESTLQTAALAETYLSCINGNTFFNTPINA